MEERARISCQKGKENYDDGGSITSPHHRGVKRKRPCWTKEREYFAWKMVSPSIAFLVMIFAFPLSYLLVTSAYQFDLTKPWKNAWIGFNNYFAVVEDSRFWHSLQLTAFYTTTTVFLQVAIGLGLALALSKIRIGRGIVRTVVLFSMILSPVVTGLTWRTLLLTPRFGLLDYIAMQLGIGSQSWLGDPQLALLSVIAMHTWQWTPFAFLVFLAALAALPQEPLEAAKIDGAGVRQSFWFITLPLLRPSIVIVIVIRTMIALRAFAAIFSATGGGPGTATEILNLYTYRTSFTALNIGYGATLATILLLITTGISFLFLRVRVSRR
jgi:multiple sugar transport system permease protein